jgi:hypothetical protein
MSVDELKKMGVIPQEATDKEIFEMKELTLPDGTKLYLHCKYFLSVREE